MDEAAGCMKRSVMVGPSIARAVRRRAKASRRTVSAMACHLIALGLDVDDYGDAPGLETSETGGSGGKMSIFPERGLDARIVALGIEELWCFSETVRVLIVAGEYIEDSTLCSGCRELSP